MHYSLSRQVPVPEHQPQDVPGQGRSKSARLRTPDIATAAGTHLDLLFIDAVRHYNQECGLYTPSVYKHHNAIHPNVVLTWS
jgi:hypothetical protein